MYRIFKKEVLNPTTTSMWVEAPAVAKKAQPGQFIILRAEEDGERIPLTVADTDPQAGLVRIIFQSVGATTMKLSRKEEGDAIPDFAGPLGNATYTAGLKKVAIVGGGVGCAIAYPVAKKLHQQGCEVHFIAGFRNRDAIILREDCEKVSDRFLLCTDDGSAGKKGVVTDALKELLDSGESYDEVFTVGPLIMMKFVCDMTKIYRQKTVVSMNPIMIDGTGMCGGCRLTVGGAICFACVDGPEFDGHLVDFDEMIKRNGVYRDWERHAFDETCNLLKGAASHG